MQATSVRWTTADLELFTGDNRNRYEIIDGELFVTKLPHWNHQCSCVNIGKVVGIWSNQSGLGQVAIAPGIIFSDADNVIPDVVWASHECLERLLDESGHLTGAPELVVEVLSTGQKNEKRDRESKLKLYSSQGVQEYWICDFNAKQVEVYRRQKAVLKLVATLFNEDELTSPLLPGFKCLVSQFF
ncbi:Uma2 family endonuclease [Dolichospermum sp. ST_con]|nr:Uma2 family endonuclease [Dolichospermum sp. ST_con]MDD1420420.1 Uma2 family endonuclease [Dolichospermum sp. ST_sed1]MDD1425852.1 Uma2 family endonuclease [Dolichospermum sp. ST_sed9]MDD1430991.1 Uma2 family endonuclease [Dolichospermum sp. ST_sed6]MDD1439613.1 Uma2 family endonuclease [Dolichospermum sp. ST_sed3]MDD1447736.1 Uma2 family endonuclease [Dolichospermum sp. ST_sed8]MDD1456123.1 Uma2 family endonuclease [Dolichospermum sp. ST_sed7]MDD1459004.1 Uma2 family endonuclease [Dolich